MSLRYEQYRALQLARKLLVEIINKPHSQWTACALKSKAAQALRHFPALTDKGEPFFSKDTLTVDEVKHAVYIPRLIPETDDDDTSIQMFDTHEQSEGMER
jgi:hypothetical protein